MYCKNCPYATINDDHWIICDIDDTIHKLYDECFFPETIMEKGV